VRLVKLWCSPRAMHSRIREKIGGSNGSPNHFRDAIGSRAPPRDVSEAGSTKSWAEARWVSILDRIEHRQPQVGLRYWGPPLWLEVTMSGPDSDLWPADNNDGHEWNWQSDAPCEEVAALADEGADDDLLLAVVGRYTVENLILNSIHEIGDWLRFDGQRVFPAHPVRDVPLDGGEDQGNGAVQLRATFGTGPGPSDTLSAGPAVDKLKGQRLVERLADMSAGPRFTYFPDTAVSFEAAGPVIRTSTTSTTAAVWRSTWSKSTLDSAGAGYADLVMLAARDVHRALVYYEADGICRAFHLDGRRPWRLAAPKAPLGPEPPDEETAGELLAISLTYSDSSLNLTAPSELVRNV
jgi:hypothetical protein